MKLLALKTEEGGHEPKDAKASRKWEKQGNSLFP